MGKEGFSKVRVDKKLFQQPKNFLPKYQMHDIEIVVDKVNLKDKKRLVEAVEVTKRADGECL